MHIDKIYKELENIETNASNLFKQGKILKSTLNMIHKKIEEIREVLKEIQEIEYGKESIIESTSENIVILKKLIESAKLRDSNYVGLFTRELLEIISENCSIDLFLITLDDCWPPLWSYYKKEDTELTFILIFPGLKYLKGERIGLIAHEVSHTSETVKRFAESVKPDKKKIGEGLADILGLCIAGPLFAYSLIFFIIKDIGLDSLSKILNVHPSWIARITILHYVNSNLWETTILEEIVSKMLNKLLDNASSKPFENLLIAKCVREYDNNVAEFLRFKINEEKIVSFKSDSLLYSLNVRHMR
ncbi:MAG: hypothetical protein PVF58_01440 [Candidatus Methanofastidiosia archaeon]|jgi:hypothetical protein